MSSGLSLQQAAVVDCTSPLRVVKAGPGSGKTRTLVAAVANDAHDDHRIAVVTYTNAAAKEVKARLATELRQVGFVGTLHAWLFRMIRKHGQFVGVPWSATVIDEDAATAIMGRIAKAMGCRASAEKLLAMAETGTECEGGAATRLAVTEFRATLRRQGLLTFAVILEQGELLVEALATAGVFPYDSLYWDEAQDGAAADFRIFKAAPCAVKMAVGDRDQSIFGFRGSDCDKFDELIRTTADTPDGRVFVLNENYRSVAYVCAAANRLIEHEDGYKPSGGANVPMRQDKDFGQAICHECGSPAEEMAYVAQALATAGTTDAAVLCRTNHHAAQMALHLKAVGLPVREKVVSDKPKDWGAATALLSCAAAPWNDAAAHSYIARTSEPGVADACLRDARKGGKALSRHHFGDSLDGLDGPVGWQQVRDMMLAAKIGQPSRDRIEEAAQAMPQPFEVCDLLLALASREDEAREAGTGVVVTTLHAAKGREWDTVFMCGMEEGLLPSKRAGEDVSEERRLAYVGMTRAKTALVLTWCRQRPQSRGRNAPPGPMEDRVRSRFVQEAGL